MLKTKCQKPEAVPAEPKQPKPRIGIAKGKVMIPEEFDQWDDEITQLFKESRNSD